MFHQLRYEVQQDEGFTLIELLVVILIIGILAAIAIPSFLNQRYKGQDACAKSTAKQMQTAAETLNTDNNSYAAVNITSLKNIESSITTSTANGGCAASTTGLTASGGACSGTPTTTGYCVAALSASSNTFAIANAGGTVTRTCSVGAGGNSGGCKGASNVANSTGTW